MLLLDSGPVWWESRLGGTLLEGLGLLRTFGKMKMIYEAVDDSLFNKVDPAVRKNKSMVAKRSLPDSNRRPPTLDGALPLS